MKTALIRLPLYLAILATSSQSIAETQSTAEGLAALYGSNYWATGTWVSRGR